MAKTPQEMSLVEVSRLGCRPQLGKYVPESNVGELRTCDCLCLQLRSQHFGVVLGLPQLGLLVREKAYAPLARQAVRTTLQAHRKPSEGTATTRLQDTAKPHSLPHHVHKFSRTPPQVLAGCPNGMLMSPTITWLLQPPKSLHSWPNAGQAPVKCTEHEAGDERLACVR